MAITRRLFLLSPLALLGCRKRREVKVEERSSRIPMQRQLDRFVAGLEREGIINTADLLGGRVVFASEFSRPQYKAHRKNRILASVNRSERPYTYKAYLGPGKMDKIYVVVPDSYIFKINNSRDHALLRAFLFHEFVHVKDRSDFGMADRTSRIVLSKYQIASRKRAKRLFLHIGHALSEIKANFIMRDFIEKEKSMTSELKEISDEHLVVWMRAFNKWLLMILQNYPAALDDVKKVCIEYIRKEFYASSRATQREINQVLKKSKTPQIK
jgi:hypothetical protein